MSLPYNSDDNNNFSLITQTIGRQLRNVASFLAPPPTTTTTTTATATTPLNSHHDSGDHFNGIKKDLAEIGSSLSSMLLSNKISKFLVQGQGDDDDYDHQFQGVGITHEVLDFVRHISVHPEYWIHFPLSLRNKDFNISHVQKDHTKAIQELVPSLATLNNTIHNYMNEQQFWMIYFVLLLPRLNDDDYALLSTPEIIQVHEALLQKLRNKKNMPTEFSDDAPNENPENTSLSEKGINVNSTERVENQFKAIENSRENHEDDLSFCEVEDEDSRLSGIRQTQSSRPSSASETSDWVRLNESSGSERKARRAKYRERCSESEESSDWLAVDDSDF